MKKPKAIFFDFDGTLLSQGQLPNSAREALIYAKSKGVLLFVATGRHKCEFEHMPWLPSLPLDGFATMNGGYCYAGDKVLYKKVMDKKTVEMVVNQIKKDPFYCIFCEEHEAYVNMEDENAKALQESLGLPRPKVCDPTRALNADIYQLVPCGVSVNSPFFQNLPNCEIAWWSDGGFDIGPQNVNKWEGILNMLPHFGLNPGEVATIGDNQNDIEMLQNAAFSIAMENGTEEAKKTAKHVTSHVDEDGILNAVKYLL